MVADWVSFSDNAAGGTGSIKRKWRIEEFSFDSKLVRLENRPVGDQQSAVSMVSLYGDAIRSFTQFRGNT